MEAVKLRNKAFADYNAAVSMYYHLLSGKAYYEDQEKLTGQQLLAIDPTLPAARLYPELEAKG